MIKKTKPISEESASPIKINRNRDSGKKRADLFARLRNTEHPLDNILPENDSEAISSNPLLDKVITHTNITNITDVTIPTNITNPTDVANITNITDVTDITNPTYTVKLDNVTNPTSKIDRNNSTPISPTRDYTKVANSIAREAIPGRLFRGMSKNTYDALYLKTRGAIRPIRKIRATKSDLIRWTGVSDVTIDKHIKHLKSVGLLKVEFMIGSHEGNWYEVLIPEEVSFDEPTNLTNLTNSTSPNLIGDWVTNSVRIDGVSPPPENISETGDSKTSFKTNTNDDEGFTEFIEIFQAASKEITGRKLTKHDVKHLASLAELLILELKIAARRTDGVSSVPAFLTEVLRRKLRNVPVLTSKNESRSKPDKVGKCETGEYEVKPLSRKEREATLIQMKEFANEDFLADFKKWYIDEDWKWLVEQLKK